jgi:hypothetical protein
MFTRCPKCQHTPLPSDQTLPAACPRCGVILAKLAARQADADDEPRPSRKKPALALSDESRWYEVLLHVPERVDSLMFWGRAALVAAFAIWGVVLIAQDVRTGEMGSSFIHRPLLIFHEAGHVVFMAFGRWLMVMGGTLGQLIMPAIMAAALLLKNRDPFGASIGLWLFGVSMMDVAPYMYDALDPQLMLLSGTTGEAGGHDWIYLFNSLGWLAKSQFIGLLTHKLGALLVLLALGWGAWVLKRQWGNVDGDVVRER